MKIAIVTDSNSGITQDEGKKLGITVIPMPFMINEEEFFEDITLTQTEFYEKLMSGADVMTSQPNIDGIVSVWKDLLKTHDGVVHIPMSSGLSEGTHTAQNFAKDFNGKVQVVNNHRISVTQKQSVFDAIKLANEGKSAEQIKEYLENDGNHSSIYIMVTTLKYLKKGGRITPAAAAIGSMLKIKPVLTIQGEKLDKFAQVISYQQGKKRMIEQICKEIETRFADELKRGKLKVHMAYTYVTDKIMEFKEEMNEAIKKYGLQVEIVDPLSLSVACHIGDGAIAVTLCNSY